MAIKNKLKSSFIIILIMIFVVMFMIMGQGAHTAADNKAEDTVFMPIIMYHSILNDPKLQNDYTISPKVFENDLKYFRENGYSTVTVSDLIEYVHTDKALPKKCVMITFDDGYYNNYYYAYPLLKKYEAKAVISPIASMTEKYTDSGEVSISYGSLSINEITEMVNSGYVEIQNHSYDMHSLAPRMGIEQKRGETFENYKTAISDDIIKAQDYFTKNIKATPNCFVYPFGAKSSSTSKIIKELGFLCTLTCTEEPNFISKNPDSLYELGRYRRDGKESIDSLMKRIENDIK